MLSAARYRACSEYVNGTLKKERKDEIPGGENMGSESSQRKETSGTEKKSEFSKKNLQVARSKHAANFTTEKAKTRYRRQKSNRRTLPTRKLAEGPQRQAPTSEREETDHKQSQE
jgi:hypothetical protein